MAFTLLPRQKIRKQISKLGSTFVVQVLYFIITMYLHNTHSGDRPIYITYAVWEQQFTQVRLTYIHFPVSNQEFICKTHGITVDM